MTLRVTTRVVTYQWGEPARVIRYGTPGPGNVITLPAGAMIDVPPGSALEQAIGPANLRAPTAAELARASVGSGGGAVFK
jgi:hypothetical protein